MPAARAGQCVRPRRVELRAAEGHVDRRGVGCDRVVERLGDVLHDRRAVEVDLDGDDRRVVAGAGDARDVVHRRPDQSRDVTAVEGRVLVGAADVGSAVGRSHRVERGQVDPREELVLEVRMIDVELGVDDDDGHRRGAVRVVPCGGEVRDPVVPRRLRDLALRRGVEDRAGERPQLVAGLVGCGDALAGPGAVGLRNAGVAVQRRPHAAQCRRARDRPAREALRGEEDPADVAQLAVHAHAVAGGDGVGLGARVVPVQFHEDRGTDCDGARLAQRSGAGRRCKCQRAGRHRGHADRSEFTPPCSSCVHARRSVAWKKVQHGPTTRRLRARAWSRSLDFRPV
jgi:hypothetical protein